MSINKRFKEIIEHFEGGNNNAFARKCALKPTTLSGIVGARQSDPSSKILNCVMQTYPEINARWLITGWGEMLENQETITEHPTVQSKECAECACKEQTINSLKGQVDSLKEDKEDLRDRVKSLKSDKQRLLDTIDSITADKTSSKRDSA